MPTTGMSRGLQQEPSCPEEQDTTGRDIAVVVCSGIFGAMCAVAGWFLIQWLSTQEWCWCVPGSDIPGQRGRNGESQATIETTRLTGGDPAS